MDFPVLLAPTLPSLPNPEQYRFPFDTTFLLLLIPTRLANCIVFLMHDNALRRMTFGAGDIHVTDVDADYFQIVSGGSLSPVLPGPYPHAGVYLQSRRLVIYDVAKKICQAHTVTNMRNLEELAASAVWISHDAKTLAVQIEDTERYNQGLIDVRIRSFDLSSESSLPMGVLELGTIPPRRFQWHAGQGLVLALRNEKVEVFDANLHLPIQHPLEEIAQELREKINGRIVDIYIHPERPCAVFGCVEKNRASNIQIFSLHLATWDEEEPKSACIASAPPGTRLLMHALSPDGKYLACSVEQDEESMFFLIPMGLEPRSPLRAGFAQGVHSCCFTRAPAAFIVVERKGRVLRWRLDR